MKRYTVECDRKLRLIPERTGFANSSPVVHALLGKSFTAISTATVTSLDADIILLILNAGVTWFMTGLIWFVQIVHYPLFQEVGLPQFQEYVERHRQMTTLVVAGPMILELFTALLLAIVWRRADAPLLWIGLGLVVAIWLCTLFFSIPCHMKLCTSGFDQSTCNFLVFSNWGRTAFWSLRAVVLAYLMYRQCSR